MSTPARSVIEISCNQFELLEFGNQGPQGPAGQQGPPGAGQQEVFIQATDPGVSYPAIWFKSVGVDTYELWINEP